LLSHFLQSHAHHFLPRYSPHPYHLPHPLSGRPAPLLQDVRLINGSDAESAGAGEIVSTSHEVFSSPRARNRLGRGLEAVSPLPFSLTPNLPLPRSTI
jgi:hypothetical protein